MLKIVRFEAHCNVVMDGESCPLKLFYMDKLILQTKMALSAHTLNFIIFNSDDMFVGGIHLKIENSVAYLP